MFLRKYIGDKAFYQRVLSIAIPLMIQQLITASVNLVDNLMVGQLVIDNVEKGVALAGVIAVNRMMNVALFALFGTMASCTIFIAQYYGAKNEKYMKQAFRFGLLANLSIGTFFCVLASLFPYNLLSFFTDDPEIIQQGVNYLRFAAMTLLPLAVSVAIYDGMRAIGDVKTPMVASAIGVILSCFFNYVLIFGHFGFPSLGVAGAAIGTLLARFIEMGILLYCLNKRNYGFKSKIKDLFNIESFLAKSIIIKGLPLVTNEIFWSLGVTTLFKFYSTRGMEVMVGFAISQSISDIFFILFSGMAAATTVIISQNLGANRLEEAKDSAYKLLAFSIFLAVCLSFIMFGTSFIVPSWFAVTEEARLLAKTLIRVVSCMLSIYMCSAQCYFILRAGGDTVATLLMDSCYMWTVNIVVVGLLTYTTNFNIFQLYLSGQATDVVKMGIAFYLVKRGKWLVNLTKKKEISYEY